MQELIFAGFADFWPNCTMNFRKNIFPQKIFPQKINSLKTKTFFHFLQFSFVPSLSLHNQRSQNQHRRLLSCMRINSPKFTDLTKNCSNRGKREYGGSRIWRARPSSNFEDQFVKPIMNECCGSI